ncbi:MAG: hypothetical protein KatS3mg005_3400 [Bryobacteraceae bacterium]|nr:MAG: hypothetical protein KatS3mg005_3400 [Bryobacteraceae bacterium]
MDSIRLAFYRAEKGKWWDKLIGVRTGSRYSHVELVLPEGTCWSASPREACVRGKRIDLGDGKWDVIQVRLRPDSHVGRMELFCRDQQGARYDWPGVISIGLSPLPGVQIPQWWFCSEFVAAALRAGGVLRSLVPHQTRPDQLHQALLGWNDALSAGGDA